MASPAIKARLRVVLYADGVMVANSDNVSLWQYALHNILAELQRRNDD